MVDVRLVGDGLRLEQAAAAGVSDKELESGQTIFCSLQSVQDVTETHTSC